MVTGVFRFNFLRDRLPKQTESRDARHRHQETSGTRYSSAIAARAGSATVTIVCKGHETRQYQIHVFPCPAHCACRPYCTSAGARLTLSDTPRPAEKCPAPSERHTSRGSLARFRRPIRRADDVDLAPTCSQSCLEACCESTSPVLARLPHRGGHQLTATCAMMHARRNQ